MGKKVLILGVAAVQMDAVSQLKKMGCETFTCAMAKEWTCCGFIRSF